MNIRCALFLIIPLGMLSKDSASRTERVDQLAAEYADLLQNQRDEWKDLRSEKYKRVADLGYKHASECIQADQEDVKKLAHTSQPDQVVLGGLDRKFEQAEERFADWDKMLDDIRVQEKKLAQKHRKQHADLQDSVAKARNLKK